MAAGNPAQGTVGTRPRIAHGCATPSRIHVDMRPPMRLPARARGAMLAAGITTQGEDTMGRTILAVVAGAVVMWLTIFVLEFVGHMLFPPPPGLNPQSQADLAAIMAQAPVGSMAMLVVAWVAGAFTGGYTAARISHTHKRGAAIAVALLVMAGVVGMIWLIPDHPIWVSALGLLLPIPMALVASRLAAGRTVGV